jgi:hypothetical protein
MSKPPSRPNMTAFPSEPVTPHDFIGNTIPALFTEMVLGEAEKALELKVGVVLRGDEGGEWTLHFVAGELATRSGRSEDCDVTVIQSVDDWRGALWEGRPALISEGIAAVVASGQGSLRSAAGNPELGNPEALKGLREVRGLIEVIISEENNAPGRDLDATGWRVGVQLGPGPLAEAAGATLRLGTEQADAMRRGDLHPVEALITGQLRIEGDLGLIMQLQAVAMLASMPKPPVR